MADSAWDAVAALVDPVRRALYDHVRRQPRAVTREQAADAVGTSRALAAFHLDKLVEAGLLAARYEAPADVPRGRGRAPKVYESTPAGIALSVPPRHYDLVGQILADAVAEAPADAGEAARRHAYARGSRIGRAHRPESGPATVDDVAALLADLGFEPRATDELILGNCPFHLLAMQQPALVCGLNEAFVAGLLDGLGAAGLAACLRAEPGACCVRVRPTA